MASLRRSWNRVVGGVVAGIVTALLALPSAAGAEGMMGANKYDLLLDYLGYASSGNGSPAYVKVTRAMGRKGILDARDAGFRFLRTSASGFYPIVPGNPGKDLLPLWQSDPAAFWRGIDAAFDDLDQARMRLVPTLIWNYIQFAAMAGETTTDFITKPRSRSRALAERYITEFVSRYRNRPTVLFYELTNEFNLVVDLDMVKRCHESHATEPQRCAPFGNVTTADLDGFAHDMTAVIRRADPGRPISSGYAMTRPNALHLAHRPEWSKGGPDWTADSVEEFNRAFSDSQKDFDILSIHLYPKAQRDYKRPLAEMVRTAGQTAHRLGKKLFLGEFGDDKASPFLHQMVRAVDEGSADYAAVWIWELYQGDRFTPAIDPGSSTSIEPGIRGDLLAMLLPRRTQAAAASTSPQVVLTSPLPCARVDRPVTLAAVASDGAGAPDRVEFLVDGQPVGEASAPPFHLQFDPQPFPARQVTIEARTHGRSGATASDSSPVLLNAAGETCNVPPP